MKKKIQQILNQSNSVTNSVKDYHNFYLGAGTIFVTCIFWFPLSKHYYRTLYNNNYKDITHVCWFEISFREKCLGRIEIGLFSQAAPKSCSNFLHLISRKENKSYYNTNVHKAVPNYMIHFGDVMNNDGTGHFSIFSNDFLPIESNPQLNFNVEGVVGLCNKGENTGGSQFFITLDEIPSLKGRYTIIGQVLYGIRVLKAISSDYGNIKGETANGLHISDCGIYRFDEYLMINTEFARKLEQLI